MYLNKINNYKYIDFFIVPGVHNNRGQIPSFSSILNNSIRIHSETTVGQDGQLQFYCGLKLTQDTTEESSKYTFLFLDRKRKSKNIITLKCLTSGTSAWLKNTSPNSTQNTWGLTSNICENKSNFVPPTIKRRNSKKIQREPRSHPKVILFLIQIS